jgi:hypothetical protein
MVKHRPETHDCPAPGCPAKLPPTILACRAHWYALPNSLRKEVWRHYETGQRAGTLSAGYKAALQRAIDFWRGTDRTL